jgi:ribosome-interacting GTPase 1
LTGVKLEKLILIMGISLYSALVWGNSVKHNPQKVGKEHILDDEDVVQIIKRI